MQEKTVLERAYELARSGECEGLAELRAKLKAEGYGNDLVRHNGPSLLRDLRRLCATAWKAAR